MVEYLARFIVFLILGDFTILSFELTFNRQIGFYLLQVYLPCAVLVSLSWITFYMEPKDIGDRLSIGVTLILTMIFLLGYINQSLPKVNKSKLCSLLRAYGIVDARVYMKSPYIILLLHRSPVIATEMYFLLFKLCPTR